jgi:hypothetical protein
MTSELRNQLEKLSFELRDLSKEIGALKSKKDETASKAERLKLKGIIKLKQYQALFYIDKIQNMSKELDKRGLK